MKPTVVLNCYAGSGAGKSVIAAEIFTELKKQHRNVELVTEYVKGWAWQGISPVGLENSLYIFAKQLRRQSILYGKVEIIVTDSPLGLCAAYEEFAQPDRFVVRNLFRETMERQKQEGRVKHLDFHLMRLHPFVTEGRYETEEEARRVDNIIRSLVPGYSVKCAKDVLEFLEYYERGVKSTQSS